MKRDETTYCNDSGMEHKTPKRIVHSDRTNKESDRTNKESDRTNKERYRTNTDGNKLSADYDSAAGLNLLHEQNSNSVDTNFTPEKTPKNSFKENLLFSSTR